MITSTSAFGKVNGLRPLARFSLHSNATASAVTYHSGSGSGLKHSKPGDDPITQRELFMGILNANATKRDAKQYLTRFQPQERLAAVRQDQLQLVQLERKARRHQDQERLHRIGVNLGGLYVPARAIAEAPQFIGHPVQEKDAAKVAQSALHVALVGLKNPEQLDEETLRGLALTLSQLIKLDMRIILVLDLGGNSAESITVMRAVLETQARRIFAALRQHSAEASTLVTGSLEIDDSGGVHVSMPRLLLDPLERGTIPVLSSLAYTSSGALVISEFGDIMAALVSGLSGHIDDSIHRTASSKAEDVVQTSIDRIILLDQAGGIPSKARGDDAHVFINLEQEFPDIERELSDYIRSCTRSSKPSSLYKQHQRNLRLLQRCLNQLPASSSGLIIGPQEAASASQREHFQDTIGGTGTRSQRNTLIHNLLTNKPVVSSSLPIARLSSGSLNTKRPLTVADMGEVSTSSSQNATLVKKGMGVLIIPTPSHMHGWMPPATESILLSLDEDPRIDFPRLLHLIENSFRRKLDVEHYLSRVRGRLAGLIIAGEYEGGAIFTWEQPPGTCDPKRAVPYLDKFAVLQSSQGSSGVADILFQSMVRTCFPEGVCWRSRANNPVNKWYFERAAGSWQLPRSEKDMKPLWTMFWTGQGIVEDKVRFNDYVNVCQTIEPSLYGNRTD